MKKAVFALWFIKCCCTAYGVGNSGETIDIIFVLDNDHAYVKKGEEIVHMRSLPRLYPAHNGKRLKAILAKRTSGVAMAPVSAGASCKNSNEKKYRVLSVSPDNKHLHLVDEAGNHTFTRTSIKLDQAYTRTDLCVYDIPQRLAPYMSPIPIKGKTSEKVTVVSIEADAHVRVRDKEGNLIDYKLESANDDALYPSHTGSTFYLPTVQYDRYANLAFTGASDNYQDTYAPVKFQKNK